MNDAEAIGAINRELSLWFDGKRGALEVLNRIAYITGQNAGAQ